MQKVISSIRRKIVLPILLIALAALGVFVFAACSDDVTEETFKARGYNVAVNYDFQGGTVNNKGSVRILVKENSKLPAPKVGSGGIGVPAKEGYSFKGFYVAETDKDGNVLRDDNDNIIVSDTEWDFKADTVENKEVTLCAKWWDNYKIVLHYGDNYKNEAQVDLPRNVDGSPIGVYESSLKVKDFTFLSYNLIKDSTNEATAIEKYPYDFSSIVSEGDSLNIDVWGKSLDGNYILVSAAKDLSISSVGEQTNYYLLDDIDMAGKVYDDEKSNIKLPKSYSGKFIGNGHTISNFTINLKVLDKTYDSFGLFRKLGDGAEISDVTFKDITLSYDISDASITSYHLGMLAGQSGADVVVKNVNITSSDQSSDQKKSSFEYLIGVGVNKASLNIADDLLIAQKPDAVVLQNCAATDVRQIHSVGVVTDDESYMLYVRYTEDNGTIVLENDAIYKLAEKSKNGVYSSKRISKTEYAGENKYVLTRLDNSVYDVTFAVNNGGLSATMVKR